MGMVCECQIFDGTQENKLEGGDAGYQILPCFQTDKDDIPANEDITNKYEYTNHIDRNRVVYCLGGDTVCKGNERSNPNQDCSTYKCRSSEILALNECQKASHQKRKEYQEDEQFHVCIV